MRRKNLSKSSFVKGLQCHKALYLKMFHPALEDKISEATQALFDSGTEIGKLATSLFPGGEDFSPFIPGQIGKVLLETRWLIKQKSIIYEAGFSTQNLLCFVDILVPNGDKWKMFEVKGSTGVSDVYLWDAAFQYYLMKLSGLDIEDVSIIHINSDYEREGELDIHQLFKVQSVMDQILPMQAEVKENIEVLQDMLQSKKLPAIDIGPYCQKPYACSFTGHCWRHIPDASVFELTNARGKDFELYQKGILLLKDIPEDYDLYDKQKIQVECEKTGDTLINKGAIREFVNGLKYPLHFLDFETFGPAIPMFNHSKPFRQMPFQYSLHIQSKPGEQPIHKEFLAEASGDPRLPFIKSLIRDMGTKGDILVYSSFEKSRLKEIAGLFPQYEKPINEIIERLVDMMDVFSRNDYYSPEMKGSRSIKKVLPALAPEFNYEGLEIADGSSASRAFAELYDEKDPVKIKKTRADLQAYCRMDTLAMVEVLGVLQRV